MRRARGPLTEHDLAAIRGMRRMLTDTAGPAFADFARQVGKVAATMAVHDAAPRHRVEPLPATVREWLDRHQPDDERSQLVAELLGRRVPEWSMRAVRREQAPPAPRWWFDLGPLPQAVVDQVLHEPHEHRFTHLDADRHTFRSMLPPGWQQW